jgi:cob(I)alamin adenosyltransferase
MSQSDCPKGETLHQCNVAYLTLNTIAQLATHPDNISVTPHPPLQTRSPKLPSKIQVIDTPGDRFCNEIVANALKVASTGERVLVVQLLKGGIRQGSDRVMNLAQNLDWVRCNLTRNISIADLNDLEAHSFQQLWKYVKTVVRPVQDRETVSCEYDLIILDDLSRSIDLGLITIESAIKFLTNLPAGTNIILTGTNPHPAILDLVG